MGLKLFSSDDLLAEKRGDQKQDFVILIWIFITHVKIFLKDQYSRPIGMRKELKKHKIVATVAHKVLEFAINFEYV